MKRIILIALLLTLAIPSWSATRSITVDQLHQLLADMQHANKTDQEVTTELHQVLLTEELTGAALQSITPLLPGPLATEQIYVLQARSSMLPPPASSILPDPAPDTAAQQALLAKAQDYTTKTFSQLPLLSANRLTARFQDGVAAVHTYSGMNHGSAQDSDPLWQETVAKVRLVNTASAPVESIGGVEKPSTVKDKTNWGANNIITPFAPPLALPAMLKEAIAAGSPHFVRWQLIGKRKVAVFDFALDKGKTAYSVTYCCFPKSDTAGMLSNSIGISAGASQGGTGTLQTISEWLPFHAEPGFHGQLFIDSELGVVFRTITTGDFNKTDFIHAETFRTDYAAQKIADKVLVVPTRTFLVADIVPNGDSYVAYYAVRHMMVTQTYSDYKLVQ